jgi:hypothetical protein
MTRGPASDKELRSEEASDLLSEGWPARKIVKHLAEKYGCSAQSARSYVREGRELLVEAVAPSDRAFMFAQVLAGLQQDRLDAKEAGNISAQVGASKAMVNHLKQIAHIDPMRDFEQAPSSRLLPRAHKDRSPRSGSTKPTRSSLPSKHSTT